MNFTSTRNENLSVKFSQAVRDCIPADGGVFIPTDIMDLRRWIYYIDKKTSFTSLAGTLTSAFIGDEFSPIICNKIAMDAFPFEPVVKQLDDRLFLMELYNGYTGYHRDYGVSYLCSYLETTSELKGGNALFLDFTHGGLGAVLANTLRGKKHVKAVLVYQKGTVRGLDESDLFWNGGNIYPVEMEGSEEQIKAEIAKVFADRAYVHKNALTVANTTNGCRLLGQVFFYPFSFAKIKERIYGDLYYALDAGNYGTLTAGLMSWKFALPTNGFIVPSTNALSHDSGGNPVILDSFVDISARSAVNPVIPANLERLEYFFGNHGMMLKNFVYPVAVSDQKSELAAKELYIKYGIYCDEQAARAYAAAKETASDILDDDGAVVLFSYSHPAIHSDFSRHAIGESPEIPEIMRYSLIPNEIGRPLANGAEDLRKIVEEVNKKF